MIPGTFSEAAGDAGEALRWHVCHHGGVPFAGAHDILPRGIEVLTIQHQLRDIESPIGGDLTRGLRLQALFLAFPLPFLYGLCAPYKLYSSTQIHEEALHEHRMPLRS